MTIRDRILFVEVIVVKWKHVTMCINCDITIAGAIFLEDVEGSYLFEICLYACSIGIMYQLHIGFFHCGELYIDSHRRYRLYRGDCKTLATSSSIQTNVNYICNQTEITYAVIQIN
jgi:hypothetical protein